MRAEPGKHDSPPTGGIRHYLRQSRQPLASLIFTAPLLVLYELGVLLFGMRNGADAWLRQILDLIGFGGYFLLPVLTVGALLAWHHTTKQRWRVDSGVLLGMFFESVLFGLLLILVANLQAGLLSALGLGPALPAASFGREIAGVLGRLAGFFGAGFYEEVLFRLLLVPVVVATVAMLGGSPKTQILTAIFVTSLAFSAAHHVGPQGEPFAIFNFVFRWLAGIYFAVLFVLRGFGIAAGSHAFYDIFVGLLR